MLLDLPCSSDSEESTCNARDLGSIPGSGRFPWRREWQPTPVFLPGKFHGQRSLEGYSPRGHKESRYDRATNTAKCYYSGNWVLSSQSTWNSNLLFCIMSCNCMQINAYLKAKSLLKKLTLGLPWWSSGWLHSGGQGLIPGQGTRSHMLQLGPSTTKYIKHKYFLKLT